MPVAAIRATANDEQPIMRRTDALAPRMALVVPARLMGCTVCPGGRRWKLLTVHSPIVQRAFTDPSRNAPVCPAVGWVVPTPWWAPRMATRSSDGNQKPADLRSMTLSRSSACLIDHAHGRTAHQLRERLEGSGRVHQLGQFGDLERGHDAVLVDIILRMGVPSRPFYTQNHTDGSSQGGADIVSSASPSTPAAPPRQQGFVQTTLELWQFGTAVHVSPPPATTVATPR